MTYAYASIEIDRNADTLWHRIGGFGALPEWLPPIARSEASEGGRIRTLTDVDGNTIVERLLAYSDEERSYRYTIVQGPAPVRDYVATLRVAPISASRSRVEWFSEFTPEGIAEDEAAAMFNGLYAKGLEALLDN
ncbi:SRPBCC family protein [Pseudomonas sp. Marseille-QA0892]